MPASYGRYLSFNAFIIPRRSRSVPQIRINVFHPKAENQTRKMNCFCETELIHGGDHDCEEEDEDFLIVSNLSCPNCGTLVFVYTPKENDSEK